VRCLELYSMVRLVDGCRRRRIFRGRIDRRILLLGWWVEVLKNEGLEEAILIVRGGLPMSQRIDEREVEAVVFSLRFGPRPG
jgi:hypothetical protein